MQFLMLVESICNVLTVDNIESVVTLVDKLIAVEESIRNSKPNPPTTTSVNS